jgi:thiol-disulfide isomerase/thioredoxin
MSRRELTWLLVAALAAGLAGLGLGAIAYGPGALERTTLGRIVLESLGETTLGEVAPPMELPLLDGAAVRLPPPGRAVLINYWASWCGPCRREMPLLSQFAHEQADNGLQVIGIAQEDPADARAYLATTPVGYRNAVEPPTDGNSSIRLGNTRNVLPYTVLIDAQGVIRARRMGTFADRADLDAWLAAAQLPADRP